MTTFYLRKWGTFFNCFDQDHDGYFTKEDFEALADKLINRGHLNVEQGATLRSHLVSVWDLYFQELAEGKRIKRDVMLEAAKKSYKNEEFLKHAEGCFRGWFASIDRNGDGVIQEDEFILFFSVIGIDSEGAKRAFQAIDTDHDGFLSLGEYVSAGHEYLTSDDESSLNRFFWGSLVDA